jgi:hypothetical protein
MSRPATILTKSAFSELTGVSAACVSQWISRKKLHGPALVGRGCRARINVPIALEQLKKNLELVTVFEASLNDLAAAMAAKFNLPHRDALRVLRCSWRESRARAAKVAGAEADALAALVEDEGNGQAA